MISQRTDTVERKQIVIIELSKVSYSSFKVFIMVYTFDLTGVNFINSVDVVVVSVVIASIRLDTCTVWTVSPVLVIIMFYTRAISPLHIKGEKCNIFTEFKR